MGIFEESHTLDNENRPGRMGYHAGEDRIWRSRRYSAAGRYEHVEKNVLATGKESKQASSERLEVESFGRRAFDVDSQYNAG